MVAGVGLTTLEQAEANRKQKATGRGTARHTKKEKRKASQKTRKLLKGNHFTRRKAQEHRRFCWYSTGHDGILWQPGEAETRLK